MRTHLLYSSAHNLKLTVGIEFSPWTLSVLLLRTGNNRCQISGRSVNIYGNKNTPIRITLAFRPCILADFRKTLIAPVIGIDLVGSEAITIDHASVALWYQRKK